MMKRELVAGIALLTCLNACRTGQVSIASTVEDGGVSDGRAGTDVGADGASDAGVMDRFVGEPDGGSAGDGAAVDGAATDGNPVDGAATDGTVIDGATDAGSWDAPEEPNPGCDAGPFSGYLQQCANHCDCLQPYTCTIYGARTFCTVPCSGQGGTCPSPGTCNYNQVARWVCTP